jgi:hypothetical protein
VFIECGSLIAWQCISPDVIVNGCKKCCISTAVDETDDDMLWNGGEEVGNIISECEEEGDTECDGRDSDSD